MSKFVFGEFFGFASSAVVFPNPPEQLRMAFVPPIFKLFPNSERQQRNSYNFRLQINCWKRLENQQTNNLD